MIFNPVQCGGMKVKEFIPNPDWITAKATASSSENYKGNLSVTYDPAKAKNVVFSVIFGMNTFILPFVVTFSRDGEYQITDKTNGIVANWNISYSKSTGQFSLDFTSSHMVPKASEILIVSYTM